MFDAVELQGDVLRGPYVDEAPDILTVPAGFDNATLPIRHRSAWRADGAVEPLPTGVAAAGPGVRRVRRASKGRRFAAVPIESRWTA